MGMFVTRRVGFLDSWLRLVGHLVGTAVLFIIFMVLAWFIAVSFHWLNEIHPFPERIHSFIASFEALIVYLDAALCVILLLAGGYRFLVDLKEVWR